MRVKGPFTEITKGERDDIVSFCVAVFVAARSCSNVTIERRDELADAAFGLLVGLFQTHDLWTGRFHAVSDHVDVYARFFGVKAPAWFTAEPSGSREQFKGLDDAARHRVRRWLNWQAVVGAVKKNGFRLDDLGLYEPKGLVDATEEHAAWLASEAQRKKAERDRKKKDREDATAAAATVPSEVEVMRERLIEVESELAAAKREIARLKAKNDDREVYREAKEQAIKAALEATLLEQGRALFERAERAEQYTEMWKARAEKAERLADRAYRAEPPTDSETVTEQEFPDVPSSAYSRGPRVDVKSVVQKWLKDRREARERRV